MEGGRLPSLPQLWLSSSDVCREDDRPVGKKPQARRRKTTVIQSSSSDACPEDDRPVDKKRRARRRKMTVMNNDDMYDDRRPLLSKLSVELLGSANATTNH
jgi:hypothetical protein